MGVVGLGGMVDGEGEGCGVVKGEGCGGREGGGFSKVWTNCLASFPLYGNPVA